MIFRAIDPGLFPNRRKDQLQMNAFHFHPLMVEKPSDTLKTTIFSCNYPRKYLQSLLCRVDGYWPVSPRFHRTIW